MSDVDPKVVKTGIAERIIKTGAIVGAITGVLAFYSTWIVPFFEKDVSGNWLVTHIVEDSTREDYRGKLKLVFELVLIQDKGKLEGHGHKKCAKATGLDSAKENSSLSLTGYTKGSEVFLFFREQPVGGSENFGLIKWKFDGADSAAGRFATATYNTSGSSAARRVHYTPSDPSQTCAHFYQS